MSIEQGGEPAIDEDEDYDEVGKQETLLGENLEIASARPKDLICDVALPFKLGLADQRLAWTQFIKYFQEVHISYQLSLLCHHRLLRKL